MEERGFMKKILLALGLLIISPIFTAETMPEVPEENILAALTDAEALLLDIGPDDEDFVDEHVLRDFIESKGLIECRQKSGLLTIAGDARAKWTGTAERVDGERRRGGKGNQSVNVFKSEVNLFFDYVADTAWASTKLRWAQIDGKDGGTATKVDLDRAFIGYDVYYHGDTDFYIELGRSKLDFMFESRVEFSSPFDGIHFYYTTCWPKICTFIAHGGPFIADHHTNHFPWVVELFFKELGGTDWGIKYSIIDWHRTGKTLYYGSDPKHKDEKFRDNPRYRFTVSQLLLGYQTKIDFLRCKSFYGYAAVLANTAAKRTAATNYRYLNKAWYIGFTMGKLCKACDWSLDINYQSVQAQAVPEFDLSGIGHGNGAGAFLSDAIINGLSYDRLELFTNYNGWGATFLFALTDSLSFRMIAQEAWPCDRSIGKKFHYESFDFAVIYAW